MGKVLVSYFSASGVTKSVAEKIKGAINSDIFEIEPVKKYTKEDLNWMNKNSRSSVEMNNLSYRPQVANKVKNIDDYDKVLIGFPVWWYTAPTIVNTFIEENNLEGKKIYVFVTSGSSGSEKSFNDLKNTYPSLSFVTCKRFNGHETNEEYISFINN